MKNLNLNLILTLVLSFAGAVAHAEKMDSETQNMVIERLESIISDMGAKDSSINPTKLRLADLLAERARLRFMSEIEKNCKACMGSVADREKALSLYQQVLPNFQPHVQGVIFFQMAHLYDIAGQDQKAVNLYTGILNNNAKNYPADLITSTRSALAELYFLHGKYKQSLALYRQVAANSKAEQMAQVQYRIAWCEFNLGHLKIAISTLENLAARPQSMTKETTAGVVQDSGFQEDVLRDLANFYSRQPVTDREIALFQKLSPAAAKLDLTLYFAEEVDRLGQKQAAAKIYRIYLANPELSKEQRLDGMVQLAQVNYENNQSAESIGDFAVAAKEYKNTSCDQKCAELQKRMKKFVTDLHRSKKSRLDINVLKAYEIYNQTFPKDTEMAILGAQVASDINQVSKSAQLYASAADSATDAKLRETALLGEVDTAERTADLKTRDSAYRHYLSLMSKGPKAFEVRYQMAQISYDQKKYSNAADQFRTLALDSSGSKELRKKSADLALDALALEKRDEDLEVWAMEFAQAFPENRAEFQKISRKAVERQIVKVANDSKSSSSDLKSALNKMKSSGLTGIDEKEKSLYFKNMSVLAERSGDESTLIASLNGQLANKNLTVNQREALLAREVGIFEKKSDFKSAYFVALKMKFPGMKNSQRELKLGTLADLAEISPKKHYLAALSSGLVGPQEATVRQRLIMLSTNKVSELKKHEYRLQRQPHILADTILAIYAENKSTRGLDHSMNLKAVAYEPAIKFIKKQYFYPQHQALEIRVGSHRLQTSNDKALGKSIKQRLALLGDADKSLATAVSLKDFTAQIMALNTVQRENQRFTQDLLSTPMPKGLNQKEAQKYVNILKQQAKPYLIKAKYAEGKIQDLWRNEQAWRVLTADLAKARPQVVPLLTKEIQILVRLAPTSQIRNALEDSLSRSQLSRFEITKKPATKLGILFTGSILGSRLGSFDKENSL